jgi:hypothetical protein
MLVSARAHQKQHKSCEVHACMHACSEHCGRSSSTSSTALECRSQLLLTLTSTDRQEDIMLTECSRMFTSAVKWLVVLPREQNEVDTVLGK